MSQVEGINNSVYFPTLQGAPLAGALMARVKAHQEHMRVIGSYQRCMDSYDMHRGADRDHRGWTTQRVVRDSKGGAVTKLKINHYGSLNRAIVTLTTATRPAFQPKARNSDVSNQSVTVLAGDVLEEYLADKSLETVFKIAVGHAVRYRTGYVLKLWDEQGGAEVHPDNVMDPSRISVDPLTGLPSGAVKEGDHVFHNLTPMDVYYDYAATGAEQLNWQIGRVFVNRFELAAKYPKGEDPSGNPVDLASRIKNYEPAADLRDFRLSWLNNQHPIYSDMIPVYWFFHERTAALPEGKEVLFLSDDTVLTSGPLRYKRVPLFRLAMEEADDTPDGHTQIWDVQAIQEGIDASVSAGVSKAQVMPIIVVPEGANIGKKDVEVPFAILTVRNKDNLPVLVDLAADPSASIKLAEYLQGQGETISGVNPVTRGNVQDLGKGAPAQLAALAQAQAISANSSLQANYQKLIGDVGTAIIEDLATLGAGVQRKVSAIAGKSRAQMVKYFDPAQFETIDAVTVESGNPLTRLLSGRVELVNLLKQAGATIDPDRIVSMLQTGRWEPVVEDMQNEENQIREENEALRLGKPVPPAVIGEDQIKHVLSHLPRNMADKTNPQVLNGILGHIKTHMDLVPWPVMPPDAVHMLARMGFMPPPPPPVPPGMGPPGAGPPPGASGTPPPAAGPQSHTPPPMHMAPPPHGPPLPEPVPQGGPPHERLPPLPHQPNGEPVPVPGVNQ